MIALAFHIVAASIGSGSVGKALPPEHVSRKVGKSGASFAERVGKTHANTARSLACLPSTLFKHWQKNVSTGCRVGSESGRL